MHVIYARVETELFIDVLLFISFAIAAAETNKKNKVCL